MRLSTFFFIFGAILLGLICGAGYALLSTGSFSGFSGKDRLELGPWTADLTIGSTATDAKTRAMVARRGILALPQSEAIYFTAFKDSEGRTLKESCSYMLDMSGLNFVEWWSLTIYDEDGFLPKNTQANWSVSSAQLPYNTASQVILTPESQSLKLANFLPLENTRMPNLLLRFYKPDLARVKNLTENDLPTIERIECRGSE